MTQTEAAQGSSQSGVPWDVVELLIDVGNRLADALEYEANPACDEWDAARYATAPYKPGHPQTGHSHIPNCVACAPLREALSALVKDVEDYGEPRRHQGALALADAALRRYEASTAKTSGGTL